MQIGDITLKILEQVCTKETSEIKFDFVEKEQGESTREIFHRVKIILH